MAFVLLYGWADPLSRPYTSALSKIGLILSIREDTFIYPLQNWLFILNFYGLMPLSAAYYMLRVILSRCDVLRMCIYGFIHYFLIWATLGTHGARWQGFLMLSVSALWLTGVLVHEIYRLRWRKTNSPA